MSDDPIPALNGLLLAIERSNLPDSHLLAEGAAVRARSRALAADDTKAWSGLYARALALLGQAVEAHRQLDCARTAEEQIRRSNRALTEMEGAASGALERSLGRWPDRIAQQKREIAERIAEAARQAVVTSQVDKVCGDTVFAVTGEDLHHFERWLAELETTWTSNNVALFATRANEDAELATPTFKGSGFRFQPATLDARHLTLVLTGDRVTVPSALETISTSYKLVVSGLTSLSAGTLAFGKWIDARVTAVAPWVLLVGAVAIAAFALATLPRQRKRLVADLFTKATAGARTELEQAAVARIESRGVDQLEVLRRHADAERKRFVEWVRLARAPAGDGAGTSSPPGGGLLPADLSQMQRAWPLQIEERIRALS